MMNVGALTGHWSSPTVTDAPIFRSASTVHSSEWRFGLSATGRPPPHAKTAHRAEETRRPHRSPRPGGRPAARRRRPRARRGQPRTRLPRPVRRALRRGVELAVGADQRQERHRHQVLHPRLRHRRRRVQRHLQRRHLDHRRELDLGHQQPAGRRRRRHRVLRRRLRNRGGPRLYVGLRAGDAVPAGHRRAQPDPGRLRHRGRRARQHRRQRPPQHRTGRPPAELRRPGQAPGRAVHPAGQPRRPGVQLHQPAEQRQEPQPERQPRQHHDDGLRVRHGHGQRRHQRGPGPARPARPDLEHQDLRPAVGDGGQHPDDRGQRHLQRGLLHLGRHRRGELRQGQRHPGAVLLGARPRQGLRHQRRLGAERLQRYLAVRLAVLRRLQRRHGRRHHPAADRRQRADHLRIRRQVRRHRGRKQRQRHRRPALRLQRHQRAELVRRLRRHPPGPRQVHGRRGGRHRQRHQGADLRLQRHRLPGLAEGHRQHAGEPAVRQVPGRHGTQLGQRHPAADLDLRGRHQPAVDAAVLTGGRQR
ncbi:hypothetical protein SCOCK_260018 [Actinacidiphila cocklensis]|uniref:Uncharacterized protein n=1 Tax=Actinacidiphila cocklensis TaxID=887465 RepID=A0A9W4GR54_9ACTN|nr:hypothetical protein SCOCK_260018 [Actinacidiphila cocklensis]